MMDRYSLTGMNVKRDEGMKFETFIRMQCSSGNVFRCFGTKLPDKRTPKNFLTSKTKKL